MAGHHAQFEAYLTQRDGRYTLQKRAIVDEIMKMKHHFEIEAFIDKVRKKDPRKFSRATVYRTVKQLFDGGFIQKITTLDGRVFYEQNFGSKHHDHLICNDCGHILEIEDPVIENRLNVFCESVRFRPVYRSLHIYGECETLKDSGKCPHFKH